MAIPPERINLKRRRSEEPLDILQFGTGTGGKRRHTEYLFQLVRHDTVPNPPAKTTQELHQSSDSIPPVRATNPGDEVKELQNLRAARGKQVRTTGDVSGASASPPLEASNRSVRRFWLTPDLLNRSRFGIPQPMITKPSTRFRHIRPPVATFVEDYMTTSVPTSAAKDGMSTMPTPRHTQVLSTKSAKVQDTLPATESNRKTGHSMHDHPSTWDIDSDQLADDLAAFAISLDPATNHLGSQTSSTSYLNTKYDHDVPMDLDSDYVYESYVRVVYEDVKLDPMFKDSAANIGLLFIDEEVEDLWQEYVNEDLEDDEEWDEEDSNAEDNPVNDYPEEELDSDDERGVAAYHYRTHGSDDEVYDIDNSDEEA